MALPSYKPVSYFDPKKGTAGSSKLGILTPDDLTFFEKERRRIRNQYLQGQSQIKHQGSVLDADYSRSKRDLTNSIRGARAQLPGSFASGGALNSGLYQRALTDFTRDKNNAFSDLLARYNEQRGGMDTALGNMLSTYKTSLDDVASAEAARRATAEAIRIAQNASF